MPARVDVKETVRALNRLKPVGRKKTIRSAGRAGARVWLKKAREKLKPRKKSGNLERSLKIRQRVRDGLGLFSVGTDRSGHHAHFVEFGTKRHDIFLPMGNKYLPPGSTVKHPGARPFPFLRPAFHESRYEAKMRVAKNLKRNIKKYTKGG